MDTHEALQHLLAVIEQAITRPDLPVLLSLRDALSSALAATGWLGYGVFFALYAALTALCLPGGSVLMLVGGACMGFMECLLLSNAACTLGAWLTMVMVQLGFRRAGVATGWMQRIETGLAGHQIAFLLSIRLAPVIPFAVFNVLAGLTRLRHWRFLWTSFVGMLPGTWLYVNAGSQLGSVKTLDELVSWQVMASVAALAVVPWGISILLPKYHAPANRNGVQP